MNVIGCYSPADSRNEPVIVSMNETADANNTMALPELMLRSISFCNFPQGSFLFFSFSRQLCLKSSRTIARIEMFQLTTTQLSILSVHCASTQL